MSEEVKTEVVKEPENSFEIEKGGMSAKVEELKAEEPKKEQIDNDHKEVGTENKPKKSRAQKRIEKLAHEKRELAKELEELKGLKEEKSLTDEINPDDFEDYDDYLDAVTKSAEAEKPNKKDSNNVKANDFQKVLDDIEVKFDETRDKYEDFDELVQKQPEEGGPHISLSMVEAINEVGNSGEVAYALAKDITESIRISKLSPIKQILAIDKLSSKLEKQTEQPAKISKKTTSAPPPINAIGGGEVVQKTLAQADNFSDYEKMRTQEQSSKSGW